MTTAEEHEVANVTPADLDALEQRLAEVERYLHVDVGGVRRSSSG